MGCFNKLFIYEQNELSFIFLMTFVLLSYDNIIIQWILFFLDITCAIKDFILFHFCFFCLIVMIGTTKIFGG